MASLGIAGAQQAFNALSGEIHASVGSALADDNRYIREAITGRLIQAYYGGGVFPCRWRPADRARCRSSDQRRRKIDTSSRMSLGAGYGAGARSRRPAATTSLTGAAPSAPGASMTPTTTRRRPTATSAASSPASTAGWAAAGGRVSPPATCTPASRRVLGATAPAQINSYVLGGYAGGALGYGFALRSGGTWTWNDIDTARSVVFPGFSGIRRARNYNGNVGQLFGELAYPILTHGGVVEPFAGLAYVNVSTGGFTESGPIAGLTSSGPEQGLGYGTLGARAGTTVVWGGTTFVPHGSARLAVHVRRDDTAAGAGLRFHRHRHGYRRRAFSAEQCAGGESAPMRWLVPTRRSAFPTSASTRRRRAGQRSARPLQLPSL